MKILQDQWSAMLERQIIPVLEYKLPQDEWLTVDIDMTAKGLFFTFDEDNKPVHFSGEVTKKGDSYFLKFDPCFEDLDSYLQQIDQAITEGYILPNELYTTEGE